MFGVGVGGVNLEKAVCAGGGLEEQTVEKNTFAMPVDWVEMLELELAPCLNSPLFIATGYMLLLNNFLWNH